MEMLPSASGQEESLSEGQLGSSAHQGLVVVPPGQAVGELCSTQTKVTKDL